MSIAGETLCAATGRAGKAIVTFACSTGERYLSTPLYQLIGMPRAIPKGDYVL